MFGMMATVALAMTVSAALVACSSDDDNEEGGGSLPAAAYDSYAAKYVINSSGSPYSSVELTEGGSYMITMSGQANMARPRKRVTVNGQRVALPASGLFGKAPVATRSNWSPILYGKYTPKGNGVYELEGFGTVTITTGSDGSASELVMAPDGGTAQTYQATKQNRDRNSAMSTSLCRTWVNDGYRCVYTVNGRTVYDISGRNLWELESNMKKWYDANVGEGEYWLEDSATVMSNDFNEVIFTKSGTYVVFYNNSELGVSTWSWADEANGILYYSWTNYFEDGEDNSGYVSLSFTSDNRLVVRDEETEDEEDEPGVTYTETTYTYLREK